MYLRKVGLSLDNVKQQINDLKGQSVNLKVNIGRKKIRHYLAKVDAIYPSVFCVIEEDGTIKTFSYSDVLCGDVEIEATV